MGVVNQVTATIQPTSSQSETRRLDTTERPKLTQMQANRRANENHWEMGQIYILPNGYLLPYVEELSNFTSQDC